MCYFSTSPFIILFKKKSTTTTTLQKITDSSKRFILIRRTRNILLYRTHFSDLSRILRRNVQMLYALFNLLFVCFFAYCSRTKFGLSGSPTRKTNRRKKMKQMASLTFIKITVLHQLKFTISIGWWWVLILVLLLLQSSFVLNCVKPSVIYNHLPERNFLLCFVMKSLWALTLVAIIILMTIT